METSSKETIIYLGRGKGYQILNTIKQAKSSVKIVSPYLSPDYIKELINLHNKGIKITLITCDNLETNSWSDFKPGDIIKKEKTLNPKLKQIKQKINLASLISLSIFLLFFPLFFFSLFYIPLLLLILTIIIFSYRYLIIDYTYTYTPIFRLKIFDSKSGINPRSTNLVHSKIFLIDNKILYLGSANFTYSAFKTHYETIIKVLDKTAINDIDKEIEELYSSKELKERDWESLV